MSAVRRGRSHPTERACLQCQRRKTKCIEGGDGRPCSYCAKSGKNCTFPGRPTRTPLTRQNLDAAEERCRELEAMLSNAVTTDAVSSNVIEDSYSQAGEPDTSQAAPRHIEASGNSTPSPYEWNETLTQEHSRLAPDIERTTRDGMASLGGVAKGTGYLGTSSGNRMLDSVTSFLPPLEDATTNVHSQMPAAPELIASQGLSVATIQSHLINAYFTCYNSSYPIVHESTFRDQCKNKSRISRASTWHIIYFMVLAIGEWVTGLAEDEQSLYYDSARARFNVENLESGNVYSVQAFLLMGNYLQKRDRPNTGYNFIGIAYRIALGLGLHREATHASDKSKMVNHRRRVLFWILYCFDSGFSLTTGRPIMVSDSFINVQIPANINETSFTMFATLPSDAEVPYPTIYSIVIAQSRLARIANRMYSQFMNSSLGSDLDHQTSTMESMLQNWKMSLPSYFSSHEVPDWFRGPRQVLFWKQANLHVLLLHASHKMQTDKYERVALGGRCSVIAAQTVRDISQFCSQYAGSLHPGISWYAVYFLLQATLALSAHQLSRASDISGVELGNQDGMHSYQGSASEAAECLRQLSHSNQAARRSLQVLSRLQAHVKRVSTSPEAMRDNPTPARDGYVLDAQRSVEASQFNATGTPNSHLYAQMSNHPSAGPDQILMNMNPASNDFGNAADPALHGFLDGTDNFQDIFQGFQGFPSTLEQDAFAYPTSSMFTLDKFWG